TGKVDHQAVDTACVTRDVGQRGRSRARQIGLLVAGDGVVVAKQWELSGGDVVPRRIVVEQAPGNDSAAGTDHGLTGGDGTVVVNVVDRDDHGKRAAGRVRVRATDGPLAAGVGKRADGDVPVSPIDRGLGPHAASGA